MILWLAIACHSDPSEPADAPRTSGHSGGLDTAVELVEADAGPDRQVVPGESFVLDAGSLPAGVEARWTLSDGQQLDGSPVQATLLDAGHFTVVLELRRSEWRSTDGASITSKYAKLTMPASQSSTMDAVDTSMWVAAPSLDEVVRVDRQSGQLEERRATCDHPVALHPSGQQVWVACRDDDALWSVPADGAPVLVTLPWGAAPRALVADGPRAWVLGGGRGEIYEVDLEEGTVSARWPLVEDGGALARVPDGDQLLAPRFRSVDGEGRVVWSGADGHVEGLDLAPDPGPDSDTNARGVPNLLQAMAVRPDGRQVAVGGLKANVARGLSRDGLPLTFETTVRADLRLLTRDVSSGGLSEEDTVLFDDRDRVSALAYDEEGDWLYVAHGGRELIDVVDPYSGQLVGVSTPVGALVQDLLVVDGQLWASSDLGRVLVRYDLSTPTLPAEDLRIDLTPDTGDPVAPEVLLGQRLFHRSSDPRLNTGGYIACASCHPDGGHDGLTWDFTDRGEGLRNTLSLHGRSGTGQGPLHWSGNFDEVQDFENDIRGPQAGDGLLDDADWAACSDPLGPTKAGRSEELDALAAYVTSLSDVPRSPHRADDGAFTAAAERGRSIFEDPARRCIECHPAPEYTDSSWVDDAKGGLVPMLHDVGTLDASSGQRLGEEPLWGVDTPTLRGVGVSGPWGHRGQAASVLALFPEGDAHGVVSDLDQGQLADLGAFLLQLE